MCKSLHLSGRWFNRGLQPVAKLLLLWSKRNSNAAQRTQIQQAQATPLITG